MKTNWILLWIYFTFGLAISQRDSSHNSGIGGFEYSNRRPPDLLDQFRRHYKQRNYNWRGDERDYDADQQWQVKQNGYRRNQPFHHQILNGQQIKEDAEIDSLSGLVQREKPVETFHVDTRANANRQVASALHQEETKNNIKSSSVHPDNASSSGVYFIALVAGCSAATVCGVIAAGFCWYKFQKNAKAAAEAEYPAYGVTGPNKEHVSPSGGGDRKLAHSAQMYHYQHQKQQMIAMEKSNGERQVSTSDLDSEDENEDGDYTVYECPGLASTGEMEVKNPLFQDDPSIPSSPPVLTKPADGSRPTEHTGF
ncbi:hypothetical protein CHUAL_006995 [Chamberlinius hualienensis]